MITDSAPIRSTPASTAPEATRQEYDGMIPSVAKPREAEVKLFQGQNERGSDRRKTAKRSKSCICEWRLPRGRHSGRLDVGLSNMLQRPNFPERLEVGGSRDACSKTASFRTLDLNLLRVFDAIMEERSVLRASEKLFLSQSAVSHSLARLREMLDDELFIRTAGGMQPTGRALAIAPLIRDALKTLKAAIGLPKFDPGTTPDLQYRGASCRHRDQAGHSD